jgi:hypothetical protein
MANEIQDAPNTVPGAVADWENELNLRELSMKGYDGISLTNWAAANTDKPQIAAGSVIEIDGAIAKFTVDTALTDEGGLTDGWCYIKFVVSGSDVVPTLTNTFGTWDTAKQGFYTSGARFSLHKMYRSGAVTKIFTEKHILYNDNGVTLNISTFRTPTYQTIGTDETVDKTYTIQAPKLFSAHNVQMTSVNLSGSARTHTYKTPADLGTYSCIGFYRHGTVADQTAQSIYNIVGADTTIFSQSLASLTGINGFMIITRVL